MNVESLIATAIVVAENHKKSSDETTVKIGNLIESLYTTLTESSDVDLLQVMSHVNLLKNKPPSNQPAHTFFVCSKYISVN
jgi:uncharacterized protein YejL (UPF0352 family)